MQLSSSRKDSKKKGSSKKKSASVTTQGDGDDDWNSTLEVGDVKDSNGALLSEGDSVVVTQVPNAHLPTTEHLQATSNMLLWQDLDPKGGSKIKRGLKIKSIHIVPASARSTVCVCERAVCVHTIKTGNRAARKKASSQERDRERERTRKREKEIGKQRETENE